MASDLVTIFQSLWISLFEPIKENKGPSLVFFDQSLTHFINHPTKRFAFQALLTILATNQPDIRADFLHNH